MSDERGVADRRKREQQRRAKALRANLARRKAQALARKARADSGTAGAVGGAGRAK